MPAVSDAAVEELLGIISILILILAAWSHYPFLLFHRDSDPAAQDQRIDGGNGELISFRAVSVAEHHQFGIIRIRVDRRRALQQPKLDGGIAGLRRSRQSSVVEIWFL